MGRSPVDEPLTLMRCRSFRLPHLYEALGGIPICGRTLQLKGHKGEIFFLFFLQLRFSFTVARFMTSCVSTTRWGGGGDGLIYIYIIHPIPLPWSQHAS